MNTQTTQGFKVEMTVLDKGALLSVIESAGYRRFNDAWSHAGKCAREYAARYGADSRKVTGGHYVIFDASGKTFAQFSVR